jgi:hypothetical protein
MPARSPDPGLRLCFVVVAGGPQRPTELFSPTREMGDADQSEDDRQQRERKLEGDSAGHEPGSDE